MQKIVMGTPWWAATLVNINQCFDIKAYIVPGVRVSNGSTCAPAAEI